MTFGFDSNPKKPDAILAGNNYVKLGENFQPEPDTFDNFGNAIALSVPQGFAQMGKAGSILLGSFPAAYDSGKSMITGKYESAASDWWFKNVTDDLTQNAVEYWTPDASKTGSAGKVMGGLVNVLTQATGGGIGLATSLGVNEAATLVEEGVDSDTALKAGAVEAASAYVGFKLPFLGKNLIQRVGFGAGSNLALNTTTTFAQNQILQAGGYDEIAQRYDAADTQARLMDVLLGAAFGGIAHLTASGKNVEIKSDDLTPQERNTILTANNAKHFQQDSAPGMPADLPSSVAHQNAMTTAMEQIARGEAVDVSAIKNIDNASFIPVPKKMLQPEDIGVARETLDADLIDNAMFGAQRETLPPDMFDQVEPVKENAIPATENTNQDLPQILQTREYGEARALIENNNDFMVNIGDETNGNLVSARELLMDIEKTAKLAETDSKAFEAAMSCYIGD